MINIEALEKLDTITLVPLRRPMPLKGKTNGTVQFDPLDEGGSVTACQNPCETTTDPNCGTYDSQEDDEASADPLGFCTEAADGCC